MDELEHKLRSALTEMAEEVAPSHHAWAEHQRRVSARKSRRPFLMAAVAAAVVALIAVPVMVLQLRTETVQTADVPPESSPPPQTTGTASPSPTQGYHDGVYRPQAGETVLTQPVTVLYDSAQVRTMAYTTERDGKQFLCTVQVNGQQQGVVIDSPARSVCSSMVPPRAGKFVWTSRLVTAGGQNGQMLYVASAPTDHVLVRKTDGTYGKALQVAQCKDFILFNVYVGANPPSAYTARDKANVTLENG